jgi:hypothetical protein
MRTTGAQHIRQIRSSTPARRRVCRPQPPEAALGGLYPPSSTKKTVTPSGVTVFLLFGEANAGLAAKKLAREADHQQESCWQTQNNTRILCCQE